MAKRNDSVFKTNGVWTWNSTNLAKKIVKTGDDDCWAWLGSLGPQTNLFGAKKNNVAQMTQARRLWYMDVFGLSADNLQIKHTCGNAYCMNHNHFEVKPNNRLYKMDGTDKDLPKPVPKLRQGSLKPVQAQSRWWNI